MGGQRKWPAAVNHGADHGRYPDDQDWPAAHVNQVKADHRRQRKHQDQAQAQLFKRDQAAERHAQRPFAIGLVIALDEIVVIVGQVAGNLQQQRAGERRQRRKWPENTIADSQTDSDEYRTDGGRQCTRPDR